jgi:ABC-2 type transport system permease protein
MMFSNLVRLPIMFISGVFIPIEELPAAGKIIANFSPLTYTVDLLRYVFQGVSYYSVTRNVLMLILFLIIFLVLGMRLHKRNLAKRL